MLSPLGEQIAQVVVARLLPYLQGGNGSRNGSGNGGKPPAQKRSFTVAECASYISRTTTAVYRLVAKRQIPCVRNGRTLRFLKDDIDKWLERGRV
jgi:excisionase family DNA binding protein